MLGWRPEQMSKVLKNQLCCSVSLWEVFWSKTQGVLSFILCRWVHGPKAIGLPGKLYTIFTGIRKSVFHFFARSLWSADPLPIARQRLVILQLDWNQTMLLILCFNLQKMSISKFKRKSFFVRNTSFCTCDSSQ